MTFASVYPGTHSVTVADADTGPSFTHALATATLTVTGAAAPSCTVTYSPSQVFPGQLFTLSWTSSGIAYASPNNATGPTIQTTNHYGTSGVILYGASGSQQYWDDRVETMSFQLGTGGVAGGTFVPLCTVSVPITSDGSSGAGTITGNTAPPNMGFSLHGTASNNGSNNLNVVIIAGTYSGSRIWSAVQPLIVSGKDLPEQSTASVTSGSWTAAFSALPEGQYTVLVYDTTSGTPVLITSGGLYVTYKG